MHEEVVECGDGVEEHTIHLGAQEPHKVRDPPAVIDGKETLSAKIKVHG